jgi:hypothetical protein
MDAGGSWYAINKGLPSAVMNTLALDATFLAGQSLPGRWTANILRWITTAAIFTAGIGSVITCIEQSVCSRLW